MSKLNEEVVSAVAIGNLKAFSEQPAMLSNLAFANMVASTNLGQQNAVSNQQGVGQLGISTLASATNTVSNLGPLEARSAVDVLTNNELAQTIADLKSTMEAFAGNPPGRRPFVPPPVWDRLLALLELGVYVNADGALVVPSSMTVFFPGVFDSEDVSVVQGEGGTTVSITVDAS